MTGTRDQITITYAACPLFKFPVCLNRFDTDESETEVSTVTCADIACSVHMHFQSCAIMHSFIFQKHMYQHLDQQRLFNHATIKLIIMNKVKLHF